MFTLKHVFWSLALLAVFTLTACGKGVPIESETGGSTANGNSAEEGSGTASSISEVNLSGILFESKGGSLITPLPSATVALVSEDTQAASVLDTTDSLGYFDVEVEPAANATIVISADKFNDVMISTDLSADKTIYMLMQQLDSKYYDLSATTSDNQAVLKALTTELESSDKTNKIILDEWDMENDIKLWITPWNNPNSPPAIKSASKGVSGKVIAGANIQVKTTSEDGSGNDPDNAEFSGKIYPYSYKIIGDLSASEINSLVSGQTAALSLWFYADDPSKPGKDYTWEKAGDAEIAYDATSDSVTLSPAEGVYLTGFMPYVFVMDDTLLSKLTVSGKITGAPAGEPIPGAMILCNDQIAVSDSDGLYSLTVSFPAYTQQISLTATANSYISKTVYIAINGAITTTTKNISLASADTLESADIKGTISDMDTGAPISGAEVTLRTPSVLSNLTTAQFDGTQGLLAGLNGSAVYKWELREQNENEWTEIKKGTGTNILYPGDLSAKLQKLGITEDSQFIFRVTVTFASTFIETAGGELSVKVSYGSGNADTSFITYYYSFLLPPPQTFAELTVKSQADGSYAFKNVSTDMNGFVEIQAAKTGYLTSDYEKITNLAPGAVIIKDIALEPAQAQNFPPTVTAFADKTGGIAPLTVNFSCEAEDDDGTIVSYNWTFGDGGVSTFQNPSHTYTVAGNYTASVTVMDDKNALATAMVNISVTDPVKSAPVIVISADSYYGKAPLYVEFTANAFDPDGTIESYLWDFGDGSFSTEQNPVHVFTDMGIYTVTATATDNDGLKTNAVAIIDVSSPENTPPTAGITASPVKGFKPLTVQFSASATDEDGYITDYLWSFGDGVTSNMQDTSYIYYFSGTFTATLTVTDNSGSKATAQVQIIVETPVIDDAGSVYAEKVFVANGYAYVACGYAGLKIMDVSNPENPVEAAAYNTPGYAQGIFVSGNYAYLADGNSGLLTFDISTPSAPQLAGSFKTFTSAQNVYISGNYAYVPDINALQVIDISVPSEPSSKGVYYVTDGTATSGGICVSGNYAYFTYIYESFGWGFPKGGFKKLDVTDPANPVLVSNNDNFVTMADTIKATQNSIHVGGIAVTFNYFLGSEETGAIALGSYREENYMSILYPDGMPPTDVPPPVVKDIMLAGNYAYLAYSGLGLYVIDWDTKISSYDTPGAANGVYVDGNYAYIADGTAGLQVINISQAGGTK